MATLGVERLLPGCKFQLCHLLPRDFGEVIFTCELQVLGVFLSFSFISKLGSQ